MLACLFHPQRESRILLLHLNKLCSLAAGHVCLGLPPVRAMRSWRDGNQGFVRGSRRVLGSCKQEKRPGRLQREKSGCPKKEEGKRPCQGKKKNNTETYYKGHVGKRERGNWKKQHGRSTDPETEKDTEGTNYAGPSAHLAAHSGTALGCGHGTMCPSTARSLPNCSQGRTPPSLAQDLFFELN